MKKLKKIIFFLVALLVIIFFVLMIYLNGTKPKISGNVSVVSGEINKKLSISRDKWGVPHIVAETAGDMFWGMGFTHASDRLFQMDMIRRLSLGRLSEVFGKRALATDKEQKDLMIEEGIKMSLEGINPAIKSLLDSYCKGVNYYMNNFALPPEFKLLRYDPEPWKIGDVFAIFKRMEVILAGSGSELYNMKIYAALGKEKAEKLISGSHGTTIINFDEYGDFVNNNFLTAELKREFENKDKLIGSNNWVISGDKTKSGKPILCNDPHLSNVFPSYFYQAKMKTEGVELSGNTIAGVPFIVIGKNKNISWGFTNVGTDVIDYFILKINPDNKNQYFLDGKWENFKELDKVIKVKGNEDHVHKILISKFGPVFEFGGKYMARHSVNEHPSTVLDAFYGMNFSKNINDFLNSLKKFSSPAQNVVFADDKGNIGYFPTGLIPKRVKGDGSLPVKTVSIGDLWDGFYGEDEKPFVVNPKKGFMVTANNRVIPESKTPLFEKNSFPAFRADRITELLNTGSKFSVEDNMRFQTDKFLKSAQFLMKVIKDFTPESKGATFVLETLRGWDLKAESGLAPSMFYKFETVLSSELFKDESEFDKFETLVSRSWLYRVLDYPEGNFEREALEIWADDKKTYTVESFNDILEKSLELVYNSYTDADRNGNMDWGEIHKLIYNHPLGSIPLIGSFLNRGPYKVAGGKDCVMITTFRGRDSFNVVHLSTFRMIIDMNDQANSRMINSSGQSGHFLSKFYDDQIELYTEGKYRMMENPVIEKYKVEVVPKEN